MRSKERRGDEVERETRWWGRKRDVIWSETFPRNGSTIQNQNIACASVWSSGVYVACPISVDPPPTIRFYDGFRTCKYWFRSMFRIDDVEHVPSQLLPCEAGLILEIERMYSVQNRTRQGLDVTLWQSSPNPPGPQYHTHAHTHTDIQKSSSGLGGKLRLSTLERTWKRENCDPDHPHYGLPRILLESGPVVDSEP